jgi:hypothetical protein
MESLSTAAISSRHTESTGLAGPKTTSESSNTHGEADSEPINITVHHSVYCRVGRPMSSESLIFVIDGHSETGWPDPEFDFFLEWSMSLDFMETIFSTALDLTQDARLFSDTDVTISVYEDIKQFFISRMSEKESCQECPDILLLDAVVRCALHLVGIEFNSILFILLMHKRN